MRGFKRRCSWPDCNLLIPTPFLMCTKHWKMLNRKLRIRISQAQDRRDYREAARLLETNLQK